MKRDEGESFEKYQERRKMDNRITKLQTRGGIVVCSGCGKGNVTLRKLAGKYYCESCFSNCGKC